MPAAKTGIQFEDVSVTRSLLHAQGWKLYANVGGYEFTGYFEDLDGYLLAVEELVKFIAVRANLLRARDAGLSRQVMPGDGHLVLPGDRAG